MLLTYNLLVIRQKSESQNGDNKKAKHAKFFGVGNIRFSENLACIAFLLPSFGNSPSCLITDELQETLSQIFLFLFF